MFTGLIETVGTVRKVQNVAESTRLGIEADRAGFTCAVGDSVAVDGTCLTVERFSGKMLFFTAVNETLARTTLARVREGRRVNLERALRLADRLGGHIVLGHVDGIGRIVRDETVGNSIVRSIRVPESLAMYLAMKGSVAIDGVSLTIADVAESTFSVSLIPHTAAETTIGSRKVGDEVNIECDVLARYIHRLLQAGRELPVLPTEHSSNSLLSKLEQGGF
jgi:riboflavin synthase